MCSIEGKYFQVMTHLKSSMENKESIIGIIGLGYVGLPLVIRFFEEGFKVVGFDVDDKKVDMLNAGESYIKHIKQEKIKSALWDQYSITSTIIQSTSSKQSTYII